MFESTIFINLRWTEWRKLADVRKREYLWTYSSVCLGRKNCTASELIQVFGEYSDMERTLYGGNQKRDIEDERVFRKIKAYWQKEVFQLRWGRDSLSVLFSQIKTDAQGRENGKHLVETCPKEECVGYTVDSRIILCFTLTLSEGAKMTSLVSGRNSVPLFTS